MLGRVRSIAVGRHRVGGHGDNRRRAVAEAGVNGGGGGIAVHVGHLDIHQQQVELAAPVAHGIDCRRAAVGHRDRRAAGGQQFARHLQVDRIVVDHQHAQARPGAHRLSPDTV
ncbi:hypothetical protein LP419_35405 [Massilia sp. H-1]|nr:hypothetical protein LP419_35405 [Massilia sp. H-1]